MNIQKYSQLDSEARLKALFMPHQLDWIRAEDAVHARNQQAMALVEKSVRIGWTYADAFKNVRKRLLHKERDYLFATKDYPSALEYVRQCYAFAQIFDLTKSIVSHGEEELSLNTLDANGKPSVFTQDVKVGVIRFDNGSRIIAFSANPQAMAVYGGDVGLDEFAKHPNARLLWETAQGRVTWNYDLAVWSSHDGEDTLFNEFAQEARAGKGPWNIYRRVTLEDAIANGLVDTINRRNETNISAAEFIAGCRARSRDEGIFQQAYMCNPMGAAANRIVEWSAIERCRCSDRIERAHLEADQVRELFGEFDPNSEHSRGVRVQHWLQKRFPDLLKPKDQDASKKRELRLGFDVAASGEGDLAVFYIDEAKGHRLSLRGLLTARTEDWHFLKSVLFTFLKECRRLHAAGDETGLGRQICWEAEKKFRSRFLKVNFAARKSDLGHLLMNQLANTEKRIPRSEEDIAADYFALRKAHTGTKWVFTEGRNEFNPASHCDIAWAGALASLAHVEKRSGVYACVVEEDGYTDHEGFHPFPEKHERDREREMLLSDDPSIWSRWM